MTHVFMSIEYIPRIVLLGHMEPLCLTFWGITKLYSKTSVTFYISTSSVWEFQFSVSSPVLVIVHLFDYSHLIWYEMVFHNGFVFISFMINFVEFLFTYLTGHLYIFIEIIVEKFFYIFWILDPYQMHNFQIRSPIL